MCNRVVFEYDMMKHYEALYLSTTTPHITPVLYFIPYDRRTLTLHKSILSSLTCVDKVPPHRKQQQP
jgi:hypothetical protein